MKVQKHVSFETIKLRVTRDVLGEYQHEVIRAHNLLDKTKAQVDTLGSELPPLQAAEAKKKSELEACQGENVRKEGYVWGLACTQLISCVCVCGCGCVWVCVCVCVCSFSLLSQKHVADEVGAVEAENSNSKSECLNT
jgi:hypothetical protein